MIKLLILGIGDCGLEQEEHKKKEAEELTQKRKEKEEKNLMTKKKNELRIQQRRD